MDRCYIFINTATHKNEIVIEMNLKKYNYHYHSIRNKKQPILHEAPDTKLNVFNGS